MKSSYSVEIHAPKERVFYWIDDEEKMMEWQDGVVENETLTVTDEVVGSTFRQIYEENGQRMEGKGHVTEYVVNERMGVYIDYGMFELDVLYTLEERDGVTVLTQDSEPRFRGFMKIIAWVMTPFMRKQGEECIQKSFAQLKQLCESDTTPLP